MQTANVFVLYTGGTIGMAPVTPGDPASPLTPQPLDQLVHWLPGWSMDGNAGVKLPNGIQLDFASLEKPLDSSNITPDDWLDMARRIEQVYANYDGFVILHGTDTMAYTAAGLSFIFENLAKPVVLTGSQLPLSDANTDGLMNLTHSVSVAGWRATGLPCVPEVVICFADKLLRGCRATKWSSTGLAAFASPNYPPLGEIGECIAIDHTLVRPIPGAGQKFRLNTDLNTRVLDFVLNPGIKAAQLEQIAELIGVDAILLRTYGAGNAPDTVDFLQAIQHWVQQGKVVVNLTQCPHGMVQMGLYATSIGMLDRGVISGLDMTPEAALGKLYWALGSKPGNPIGTEMQLNQRGEQSLDLFDLCYGKCGDARQPQSRFDHHIMPDHRFNAQCLTRSVVRIQGFGLQGVAQGQSVKVRLFMHKPEAEPDTPADDPHCVARFAFSWTGVPEDKTFSIDSALAQTLIGPAGVTLSIRTEEGVAFWFDGLHLRLFGRVQ